MITLIWAQDEAGGIGLKDGLPWPRIPEDMAHFKNTTGTNPVIMGRKTFATLGKPLPKRKNIVLTRDPAWHHPDVEKMMDVNEALFKYILLDGFVIGGAEIYEAALPYAHCLIITKVVGTYEADTFFKPNLERWHLAASEPIMRDDVLIANIETYYCIVPEKLV